METATALRTSFADCLRPSYGHDSGRFRNKSLAFSTVPIKQYPSISRSKLGFKSIQIGTRRKVTAVRASSSSDSTQPFDSAKPDSPIAPLQLESPVGQFLSQILVNHPHLVPAAVEQQLEQLQTDRDAQKQNEDPSVAGTDIVLYKRIAEVKAKERMKALEEILYALVVQKFLDANVPLIPSVSTSRELFSRVDKWPRQDEKLELLHSPEAREMIQNHLAFNLGNRVSDSTSVVEISKLRVGQLYAASVMYGYFLKRIDQRFQLEKTIKILPEGLDKENSDIQRHMMGDGRVPKPDGETTQAHPEVSSFSGGPTFAPGLKPSPLRNYVMSFDAESLQRYATIRSKEAVNIIEKHTEALFGRPEIVISPEGKVDSSSDDVIKISFTGIRSLVLEAVTFGSFLWDVESYVDSRYHFVAN